MEKVFIKNNMSKSCPEHYGYTLTVEKMINILEELPAEAKVYIYNEDEYTYGSIKVNDISEDEY